MASLERLGAVLEQIGADPRLPNLQAASDLPKPKRARIRSRLLGNGRRIWHVDLHDPNGLLIDTFHTTDWHNALLAARHWTHS